MCVIGKTYTHLGIIILSFITYGALIIKNAHKHQKEQKDIETKKLNEPKAEPAIEMSEEEAFINGKPNEP